MATLTIRDVDEELKARLRVQAAEHGRSMEAEVRAILRANLETPATAGGLGSRIHQRVAAGGGVDLPALDRAEPPRAATYDS